MITPALSHRIAKAFNTRVGLLLPRDDREKIVKAVEEAETWENLPSDIKQVIEEIEENPNNIWPVEYPRLHDDHDR